MLALLFLVIIGLGMAFFATQNVFPATITIANNTFSDIPLYMIVLGSLLLGIFISWVVSLTDGVSSSMALHGKNAALHNAQRTIDSLKRRIHDLELENSRIRGEQRRFTQTGRPAPSFFDRLRNHITPA